MALPSSGAISIDDINIEFGLSSGRTASLQDFATGAFGSINTRSPSYPNSTTPHSMSEWYGYDHNYDRYYWLGDGVNDTMRYTGSSTTFFKADAVQDMSFCGWYRIDETTMATQQLMSASTATPSGNDQIFIQYSTLNRLLFRYRHGGTFHQIQKALHDNSTITGVTSSSTGWTASTRGNTNSDGFVFLCFTYDASNRTASSGMKIYWNAQELTTTASSSNITSPASWDARSFAVGDLISSSPNNANVWKGGIDCVSVHGKVLSQSEITALYNSGQPIYCKDANVTSNLLGEYRLENTPDVQGGGTVTLPDLVNTGGIFTTY